MSVAESVADLFPTEREEDANGPKASSEHGYLGAFPPPPSVTPNLENPPDAGRTVNMTFFILCTVLISIFFATRVWVKVRVTRNILIEDMMCLAAWATTIFYIATVFMSVSCAPQKAVRRKECPT
jgi:hypothetical protein